MMSDLELYVAEAKRLKAIYDIYNAKKFTKRKKN